MTTDHAVLTPDPPLATLDRVRLPALRVGAAALVLFLIAIVFLFPGGNTAYRQQFFRSYLQAYLLWLGAGLGCAALLMLHHLTGGNWGWVIRRPLEAGAATIPIMAVLFVPILLAVTQVYLWPTERDHLGPHKRAYLSVGAFTVRSVAYLLIWIIIALALLGWSARAEEVTSPRFGRFLRKFSAAGLLLWGITISLASVDWVMSLEQDWYSTVFGMIFMVGQALTALCVTTIAVAVFVPRAPQPYDQRLHRETPPGTVPAALLNDLGNLIFTFVILYTYMAFSQYLIIWCGNIREEVVWYTHRTRGVWRVVGLVLVIFHFAVPFLALLHRRIKRNPRTLVTIAVMLIVMRQLDMIWMISPSPRLPAAGDWTAWQVLYAIWLDLAAPLAMGGLWFWFFLYRLRHRPLLPDVPFDLGGHHG
jgi:hypothetical protein